MEQAECSRRWRRQSDGEDGEDGLRERQRRQTGGKYCEKKCRVKRTKNRVIKRWRKQSDEYDGQNNLQRRLIRQNDREGGKDRVTKKMKKAEI